MKDKRKDFSRSNSSKAFSTKIHLILTIGKSRTFLTSIWRKIEKLPILEVSTIRSDKESFQIANEMSSSILSCFQPKDRRFRRLPWLKIYLIGVWDKIRRPQVTNNLPSKIAQNRPCTTNIRHWKTNEIVGANSKWKLCMTRQTKSKSGSSSRRRSR